MLIRHLDGGQPVRVSASTYKRRFYHGNISVPQASWWAGLVYRPVVPVNVVVTARTPICGAFVSIPYYEWETMPYPMSWDGCNDVGAGLATW